MRVFREQGFQLRVPALEVVQQADLCLQLLNLRLELDDVRRQVINRPLLLVRIGLTLEGLPPKGRFKEPEEGARPLQIGLVDLPGHRVR
jgi:hypothetical protein